MTVLRNSKSWVPVADRYIDAIDNGLEKGFADFKSGRYIKSEKVASLFEELKKANNPTSTHQRTAY